MQMLMGKSGPTRIFTTGALAIALMAASSGLMAADIARGTIFHDLNANGTLDEGEPGISGVPVSNGYDVVVTDSDGRWELPVDGDTVIFYTKPSGYAIEVNEHQTPQFYYIHRPDGSPEFRYPGVEPTGPLPESIDFPLRKVDEPEDFRVVLFADPQPRNAEEVDFVLRSVVGEVRDTASATLGMSLGDIMFDDLSLFEPYIRGTSEIGIPMYGVIGNHDLNFDSPGDFHAGETYIRHYGPRTYSFNVGKVHFICMDNIVWNGGGYEETGNYNEAFRDRDLEWLARNLEHVPDDYLVVLGTHGPLWMSNRREGNQFARNIAKLFEVLKDRHRILAVNGHTHYTNHRTFGPEDGWHGEGHFHQHNIVTVSGAWWSGPRDSLGIPTTEQRDGTPNGYVILEITGNEYRPHYKAAGKPAEKQMNIYPPGHHSQGDPAERTLLVNVFDGMMHGSEVVYRVNGSDERAMAFKPQTDPVAVALYSEDSPLKRSWVNPVTSHHIWEAQLAEDDLVPGANFIEVHYSDTMGRRFVESLSFLREVE